MWVWERALEGKSPKANPEIVVGLIPCAVGGSPISTWEPGQYYPVTKSHPYDDALRRARAALKSGTLKGILWHQGESDSKPELAPLYKKKLHALIARFRKELSAPKVPFIAGQMGQFKERPWSDSKKQVDAVHRELPNDIPHSAYVNSDGLKHKGDNVHFDAASYREFGKRYAKAYFSLTEEGIACGFDRGRHQDRWSARVVCRPGFDRGNQRPTQSCTSTSLRRVKLS